MDYELNYDLYYLDDIMDYEIYDIRTNGWTINFNNMNPAFEFFLHICRFSFCPLPLDSREFNFEEWQDYEIIARNERRRIFNNLMIPEYTHYNAITEANWNTIINRLHRNSVLTNEDIVFIFNMLDQPSTYTIQWWHPNNVLPDIEKNIDSETEIEIEI